MPCPRTQHRNNVPILRGEKHEISLKILHQQGFETARQAATMTKLRQLMFETYILPWKNTSHLWNEYIWSLRPPPPHSRIDRHVWWEVYVSKAICRPLGYERVYLPLCKVADTSFHIQGDDVYVNEKYRIFFSLWHSLLSMVHLFRNIILEIFKSTSN